MTAPKWMTIVWHAACRAPSAATVVAVAGSYLLIWYAYNGGLARADELAELNSRVNGLADALREVKTEVTDGRIEALQSSLFEARVSQCSAESEELKRLYGKRVVTLQESYRELTGYEMTLPDCGDL